MERIGNIKCSVVLFKKQQQQNWRSKEEEDVKQAKVSSTTNFAKKKKKKDTCHTLPQSLSLISPTLLCSASSAHHTPGLTQLISTPGAHSLQSAPAGPHSLLCQIVFWLTFQPWFPWYHLQPLVGTELFCRSRPSTVTTMGSVCLPSTNPSLDTVPAVLRLASYKKGHINERTSEGRAAVFEISMITWCDCVTCWRRLYVAEWADFLCELCLVYCIIWTCAWALTCYVLVFLHSWFIFNLFSSYTAFLVGLGFCALAYCCVEPFNAIGWFDLFCEGDNCHLSNWSGTLAFCLD